MTTPSRLHLHIGSTKTGSSAFQRYCNKNRARLLASGVLYPENGVASNAHHLLAATLHPNAKSLHRRDFTNDDNADYIDVFRRMMNDIFIEARNSGVEDVLVSSEYLWGIFPQALYDEWARALGAFRSVNVIAVIRKPDNWLQSWYLQTVKNGEKRDFHTWRKVFAPDAQAGSNFLGVLDGWGETLGRNNIRVFEYERLLGEGDFCQALLKSVFRTKYNSQKAWDAFERSSGVENPSPSNEVVELLLAVNRSDIPREMQKRLRNALLQRSDHRVVGSDVTVVSAEVRREILGSYATQIRTIRERYNWV